MFLPLQKHSPFKLQFCSKMLMGSKHLLKSKPPSSVPLTPFSARTHQFHTFTLFFTSFPSKPISNFHPFSLKTSGFSYTSHANIPRPVPEVYLETPEVKRSDTDTAKLEALKRKMKELNIDITPCIPGQYNHLLCPMCKGGDSVEKSLSLFITQDGDSALWMCFRGKCGWKGTMRAFADGKSSYGRLNQVGKVKQVKQIREITEESLELEPLCPELLTYFAERVISGETLRRNSVMQKISGDQIIIAFTYRRNGALVSCKYRDINKKFWQEKDTEKIFYGLDDIKEANDIIIVEGEMDKLALEEAGFRNCVSVPDGAPPAVSSKDLPPEEQDTKYQYLWNCKEYLEKASRIILATDGDAPGQALAEELARRLGRERCWRVTWPKKNDLVHFKDANEVLMFLGSDVLRGVIESAELYPIRGLFNFRDYFDEIDRYYHQTLGYELGESTGWRSLNQLYNVVPGELTIVTGVPNSGKSEWIDALLVNLNKSAGWRFALCSMENKVREHARKLLEKHVKKPFFDARYGECAERMSVEELEEGKKWLNDTFYLIRCENDSLPNVTWVLDLAKAAVLRHGVRGLVIDPYNELDHQRHPSQFATVKRDLKLVEAENSEIHNEIEVLRGTYVKGLNRLEGDLEGLKHSLDFVASQVLLSRWNLNQLDSKEVGCNHAQSVGFSIDGLATTLTMRELHLIWVTARMHIEIYKYPAWSDVVEIETWCQGEGSYWILKDYATGEVIGRATRVDFKTEWRAVKRSIMHFSIPLYLQIHRRCTTQLKGNSF